MSCPSDAYLLPPLEDLKKKQPPWNIIKIRHPERVDVQDGMLKLSYQEGERGNESGGAVFANPFGLLPAEGISMDYEVYLPECFEWVKAGKFPGIALGKKQGEHASGGGWKEDAGSFRIMWQKPEGDRALIKGYLYLAIHGGTEAGYEPQGPHTKAALDVNDRTGFSMWYKKQPGMYAEKCKWNSMGFTVVLNTPGKADGVLEMRVNGVTKRVDDVVWRTSGDVKIVDMYFVSIFGGRAQSFACKKATHSLYRNIRFAPVK